MLTDARKSGSVSAAGGARDGSVPGKLMEKSRQEFVHRARNQGNGGATARKMAAVRFASGHSHYR